MGRGRLGVLLGLSSCGSVPPPFPGTHNLGAGGPIEEVPGAICSPTHSGEETGSGRLYSPPQVCLLPLNHIEGSKEGGERVRRNQKAGLSPLSDPSMVLRASVPLSGTGSLWVVGPWEAELEVHRYLCPVSWV